MAFGSLLISNTPPTVLNPFLAAPSSASAAPAAQSAPGGAAPGPAQSAAAPSGAPARPTGGARTGGGGGAAAATAAAAVLETATVYTTTVAGKQYSGSVVESDGEYTASVPNVPGATATGTSEQAAENNLDTRIDELV